MRIGATIGLLVAALLTLWLLVLFFYGGAGNRRDWLRYVAGPAAGAAVMLALAASFLPGEPGAFTYIVGVALLVAIGLLAVQRFFYGPPDDGLTPVKEPAMAQRVGAYHVEEEEEGQEQRKTAG